MNRSLTRIVLTCLGALAVGLVVLGAAPQNITKDPLPKPNIPTLCSDFVATLDVQKGNDGSVQLSGRMCNAGPGGYSNASGPLDAYFMVYTWHPPKTPAQEGDLKLYQHTNLGTAMKANECKIVTYKYQVENFSRWGSFPLIKTERPAMKQFCFQVAKKGPTGFSKCEDSNIDNTTACLEVAYMEKIK